MKFISTRLKSPALNFEETVMQGLAPDGGLYVPEFLPQLDEQYVAKMSRLKYQEIFFEITKHFIGDEIPVNDYKSIIDKSYKNFSHKAIAPVKQLDDNHFLLELFHGPTLAFKDFALQYLGNLLDYFLQKRKQKIAIIGATSGDTGSAAIHGCMQSKNAQIFILHPYKKVSEVQRRQMTTILADNVFNIAIKGNFDDGQKMVKTMFAHENTDKEFLKGRKMVAVNSINFARLMAQIAYYFYVASRLNINSKNPVSFSVPTGNFGDIYAGFMAKRMGLNINRLIIATNSNDILHRFLQANDYTKQEMVETISPSMNIQVSSNFERLLYDYHKKNECANEMFDLMANFEQNGKLKVFPAILEDIQKTFLSYTADDKSTKKEIKEQFVQTGEILDPHTAVGTYSSKQYMASNKYKGEIVITLATAHPAKFPDAFKSLDIKNPELPEFLKDLNERQERYEILNNELDKVKEYISSKL